MVLEKARAQPLSFPSLLLPSLSSVPQVAQPHTELIPWCLLDHSPIPIT